MDMRLNRCTSTTTTLQEDDHNRNLDRLTCLPDELLIYIIFKADLVIENYLLEIAFEVSGQLKLSLLRPLSNVQHLTVNDTFLEELNHEELKDQLPVFCYLKCLELGFNEGNFWDNILFGFLNRSPVLETLVFPEGLTAYPDCHEEEELASEQQFCRTALADVPTTCCRYHLKKIVIKNFLGYDREIDLIQFFLTYALVLENLVIYPGRSTNVDQMMTVESTLQNLPRASVTCSIQGKLSMTYPPEEDEDEEEQKEEEKEEQENPDKPQ